MVTLHNKISVYVPATMNVNKHIDNTLYVKQTAMLLSNCFGGCSAQQINGYYVDKQNNLVTENTTIVYSFCDDDQLIRHSADIIDYCFKLCDTMQQECIGMEINGEFKLIESMQDNKQSEYAIA
jgi:hypothetical protein